MTHERFSHVSEHGNTRACALRAQAYLSLFVSPYFFILLYLQDYVQNTHAKEIDLSRVTIKIPGVIFRQTGGQAPNSTNGARNAAGNEGNLTQFS